MITNFRKKQKKNLSRDFLLVFGGVLILGMVVTMIVANVKTYQKRKQLFVQVETLKAKIEDLKTQNSNFKENIAKSNDQEYNEKIAREELDLQKEGEHVVSFIISQGESQKDNSSLKNFLQIWLGNVSNFWNLITR